MRVKSALTLLQTSASHAQPRRRWTSRLRVQHIIDPLHYDKALWGIITTLITRAFSVTPEAHFRVPFTTPLSVLYAHVLHTPLSVLYEHELRGALRVLMDL